MKIGLYGATGSRDFGDYAMMIHNIQDIWNFDEDIEFFIITPDKYVTLQNLIDNLLDVSRINHVHLVCEPYGAIRLREQITNRIAYMIFKHNYIYKKKYIMFCRNDFSVLASEFKQAFKEIDILLFNGGGYIQHSWGISIYSFMTSIEYAHILNIPVFFLSNSIGPLGDYKKIVYDTLPCVSKMMIRDGHNYTENILKEIGYEKYINGPDDLTFVNDVYNCKSSYSDYVIIEIMSWLKRANKGSEYILHELIKMVNYIIDSGRNIVLVTFDNSDIDALKYIDYIFDNATNKERIFKIQKIETIYQIFGLYHDCDFSISFKYHPVILAIGSNKPFIGIICDSDGYYEGKLKGACENLGLDSQHYIIHVDSISADRLIDMYNKNIKFQPVKKNIINENRRIRDQYLQSFLRR